MPTTVVKTIGSTGDYSTLALWEAGSPADLTAVDQIWQGQCQNQTFSGSTTLLTISGTTVDSTRYTELTTVSGASFRDNANVQTNALRYNTSNGVAITSSIGYAATVLVSQDFCRISNLQIANTATGAGSCALRSSLTGTPTLDVNNCILEGVAGGVLDIYGPGEKVRNSAVINRGASKASIAKIQNSASAINCTFATPSDKTAATVGLTGSYGTCAIKNCAIFGAAAVNSGSTTYTFTTCYTGVGSPPSGCTTATYNTSLFVNITDATRDYRIPSGSSLIDVGTTDSTNAATDIANTARPSGSAYDVGAWEFVAAGGGNTIAVPAGSLTLTGFAPTIVQSNNQIVSVPAGSLTLTGFAPTIVQSNNQIVAVPAGSLTLTGFAPTVTATANNVISVPLATLTLSPFAPVVDNGSGVVAPAVTVVGSGPARRKFYVEIDGRYYFADSADDAAAILRAAQPVVQVVKERAKVEKAQEKVRAVEAIPHAPEAPPIYLAPNNAEQLQAILQDWQEREIRAYEALLDDDEDAITALFS